MLIQSFCRSSVVLRPVGQYGPNNYRIVSNKERILIVTQQEPKYIKGDGLTGPDLKLFVGAHITVTYWQADPENKQQPTVTIKNDRQPDEISLRLHSNEIASLANVLMYINGQVN